MPSTDISHGNNDQPCVKIVTPIGMIGYSYNEGALYKGIAMGATAIIADSGSTDSGPQKLALGSTTCPREAYARDLKPMLDACWLHRVKVLVGSAGGDGSNQHVDEMMDIISEYSQAMGYKFKVVKIYAEIDRAVIHDAFNNGKVTPCGAAPPLEAAEIDASTTIVAQMGMEPFIQGMREVPDYDIIIAGRVYDPSPYAAYAYFNGITNMGTM